MQKKAWVYKLVLILWVLFSLLLLEYLIKQSRAADNAAVVILLSLSIFSLIIFWLGSVRDLVFSAVFALFGRRMMRAYEPIWSQKVVQNPRFVLLYCTYNDFNGEALSACMHQEYENFETVILDDSTKAEYKEKVDRFALENGVSVVRRADRKNYKAGNLNHYLKGRDDYDYFVVLDSDERIPPDFIRRSLRYFAHDEKIGAVQARHVARKGKNVFQRLLGLSVESNGRTAQIVKNFYGSNALLGHGMAISLECYRASGGFPPVVAEDISFAVQIKNAGYEIMYAPDIVCEEEFPFDYVSLKKRQCKWTQGNLEYMQKYNASIIGSKLRWFEKLDMILSHYMLPITPILSLLLVLSNILLGFFDYAVIEHTTFIYSLMFLFLLSPLLVDIFVYGATKKALLLLPYFAVNIVTYASMAPMMIKTVFQGAMGKKAVFLVTPKDSRFFSIREIIRFSWDSLYFSAAIGAFCYLSCGTVFPALLVVGSCALAPLVVALSNVKA